MSFFYRNTVGESPTVSFLCRFFYRSSYLTFIYILYPGVARDVNFIPTARVPVLQYVSNHFGISCDISVDNYPGRIKSKVLYWISTIDERFGDMVLLVSSV
jgi:DNA polymerase sigma